MQGFTESHQSSEQYFQRCERKETKQEIQAKDRQSSERRPKTPRLRSGQEGHNHGSSSPTAEWGREDRARHRHTGMPGQRAGAPPTLQEASDREEARYWVHRLSLTLRTRLLCREGP